MDLNRYYTIMVIPEGQAAQRAFRIRQWHLQAGAIAIVIIFLLMILFFASYSKIMVRAALTDKLQQENEQLLKYQYKVKILEENINQMREMVTRLTTLAGIDYKFPDIPDDSTLFAAIEGSPAAAIVRSGTDLNMPQGLPIEGVISQGFQVRSNTRYHPGIDIATPVGTPVLATASGLVVYADFDSTYGNMLVLRHNDTVTTLYGHNESLLVAAGQEVPAGGRIALSGNTGKSTAPHLHYEVRINDEPINPVESPYDQEERK